MSDLLEAIRSARDAIAFSSRDWSLDSHDSWVYGIVVGCGDSLSEVAARHGWTQEAVDRVRQLREAVEQSDAPAS